MPSAAQRQRKQVYTRGGVCVGGGGGADLVDYDAGGVAAEDDDGRARGARQGEGTVGEGAGEAGAGGGGGGEVGVLVGVVGEPAGVARGERQRGARRAARGETGEAVALDLVRVGGVDEEEDGVAARLEQLADDLHVAQHVARQDGDGGRRVGAAEERDEQDKVPDEALHHGFVGIEARPEAIEI